MVSPQTQSRDNKRKMLKEIIDHAIDLLAGSKERLDSVDSRNIKKIVSALETWKGA